MSSSRKCTGRLFQRRGPAAAKLLSPNVLCVRGTESTSWTFRNQVYVVSQVRRCLAGQRRVNETCQLKVDTYVILWHCRDGIIEIKSNMSWCFVNHNTHFPHTECLVLLVTSATYITLSVSGRKIFLFIRRYWTISSWWSLGRANTESLLRRSTRKRLSMILSHTAMLFDIQSWLTTMFWLLGNQRANDMLQLLSSAALRSEWLTVRH